MIGKAMFCTPAETAAIVRWAGDRGARVVVEPQAGEGGSRWAWVTIEGDAWPGID